MKDIEEAKKFLKESCEEFGYSSWLEGWICGYADGEEDSVYDSLFEYLKHLKNGEL
jgi:hypothetical protein